MITKEKKPKKENSLYERVQRQRQINTQNIINIQNSYKKEEELKKKSSHYEEVLYREFVRANKGKDFIDIDHIDSLGVYYDILIVTSIKNTGKNVGIVYKMFNKYYKEGKKIVFMRTSQKEIADSSSEYIDTPANPFYWKTKGKVMTMYHKETNIECGVYKDFKTCNLGSGGEYHNYGAIIYDEFMSWSPNNELRHEHYLNWGGFISSVTRNKKEGIKVYCVGNLTGRNTMMLDFYGISRDDNLRYIKRTSPDDPDNICHILYINANDIYKGIRKQIGAVHGMSPELKQQLYKNEGEINNLSIVTTKDWDKMHTISSFIYIMDPKIKILFELRQTIPIKGESAEPILVCVRGREWHKHYHIEGDIYTDSYLINSSSHNTTYIRSVKKFIMFLYNLSRLDELYFYDLLSQDILLNIFFKLDRSDIIKPMIY